MIVMVKCNGKVKVVLEVRGGDEVVEVALVATVE